MVFFFFPQDSSSFSHSCQQDYRCTNRMRRAVFACCLHGESNAHGLSFCINSFHRDPEAALCLQLSTLNSKCFFFLPSTFLSASWKLEMERRYLMNCFSLFNLSIYTGAPYSSVLRHFHFLHSVWCQLRNLKCIWILAFTAFYMPAV